MKVRLKKKQETQEKKQKTKELNLKYKLLICAGIAAIFELLLEFVFKCPIGISIVCSTYLFLAIVFALGIPSQASRKIKQKIENRYELSDKYTVVYLRTDNERRRLDPARIMLNNQNLKYQAKKNSPDIRIRVVSDGKVIYTQDISYREFRKNFKPRWE